MLRRRLFAVNEVTPPLIDTLAIGAYGTIYVGANTLIYEVNPDDSEKWSSALSAFGYSSPAMAPTATFTLRAGTNSQR